MLKYSWLAVIVIIIDQVTKVMAESMLVFHQPVAIIPHLNFTLAYNTGAAFSFLHDAGGWQHWLFTGLASVVSVYIVFMLKNLKSHELQMAIALGLILGGAIGNLIDRILHQHVIDFIDFYYGQWHFATFNIADSAISVGAVLLILETFGLRLIKSKKVIETQSDSKASNEVNK